MLGSVYAEHRKWQIHIGNMDRIKLFIVPKLEYMLISGLKDLVAVV